MDKLLIRNDQINEALKKMSLTIQNDHIKDIPIFLGILNGAFIFMADLIRFCNFDLEVDFCRIKSYQKNVKSSEPFTIAKWTACLTDRVVIIVDDILDTGETIRDLIKCLEQSEPKEIKICVLLKRKSCKFKPDYFGFEIDNDNWVYGYGLDDDQLKRNKNHIYVKR